MATEVRVGVHENPLGYVVRGQIHVLPEEHVGSVQDDHVVLYAVVSLILLLHLDDPLAGQCVADPGEVAGFGAPVAYLVRIGAENKAFSQKAPRSKMDGKK